jgi:hypothetical protein
MRTPQVPPRVRERYTPRVTEETQPTPRRRAVRMRWILGGVGVLIIAAGTTGAALALASSPSGSPHMKGTTAPHIAPPHTAAPVAVHTSIAAKRLRSAHPSRSPSHPARSAAPVQAPAPSPVAPQPSPTSVPQQDCYALPYPTCTPPPPPSSLLTSPYTTSPTPVRPTVTISETP